MNAQFNLSTVFRTVAATVPDQEMLVWRDRRLTYADADARVDGVAPTTSSPPDWAATPSVTNWLGTSRDKTTSVCTCETAMSTSRP